MIAQSQPLCGGKGAIAPDQLAAGQPQSRSTPISGDGEPVQEQGHQIGIEALYGAFQQQQHRLAEKGAGKAGPHQIAGGQGGDRADRQAGQAEQGAKLGRLGPQAS